MSRVDLKRFKLLSELQTPDLEMIESLLEPIELRPGQPVFREGQEAEGLILIDEGALRFESQRAGVLGRREAGSAFGGISLVAVGPRELTAMATERSRLLVLSRTAFHRLSEDAPRAALRILEAVLHEFGGLMRGGLDRMA